jgi:hypothetical protein
VDRDLVTAGDSDRAVHEIVTSLMSIVIATTPAGLLPLSRYLRPVLASPTEQGNIHALSKEGILVVKPSHSGSRG